MPIRLHAIPCRIQRPRSLIPSNVEGKDKAEAKFVKAQHRREHYRDSFKGKLPSNLDDLLPTYE